MSVDLRQYQNPAYTGENRCMPCTITNVCIAVVLGALVFVVSPLAAAVVVAASLGAIYFRGYLVPGTPTLTKRYFPDRLLAVFDVHPPVLADDPVESLVQGASGESAADGEFAAGEESATGDGHANSTTPATGSAMPDPDADVVEPERLLLDLDVVRPCEEEDDLCLTEAFAADWYDRMGSYRDDPRDPDRGARLLDVSRDELSMASGSYPRLTVTWRTRRWPSDGALIADTAADAELDARYDDWRTLHLEQRLGILKALRTFIETCPLCNGSVEMAEDTIESCCRSREVIAVTCQSCEERFLEIDPNRPGVKD